MVRGGAVLPLRYFDPNATQSSASAGSDILGTSGLELRPKIGGKARRTSRVRRTRRTRGTFPLPSSLVRIPIRNSSSPSPDSKSIAGRPGQSPGRSSLHHPYARCTRYRIILLEGSLTTRPRRVALSSPP